MDFAALVGVAVAAFVATDIDDIFILIVLFSAGYPARQVVAGQYLGISLLVTIGVLGALVALVVPPYVIGLMGIAPIAIGIKKLLELRKNNDEKPVLKGRNAAALSVAAVTFANGGDNIAVYVPLFASYNTASEMATLAAIFMAMTGAWCAVAHYLVKHPLVAARMHRIGRVILPFVLMGLGAYIIAEAFLVPS